MVPLHVALVLTHSCNLDCTYCYMGAHLRRSMPVGVALRALEWALSQDRDVDLSFFGGEPLLEWELLAACARRARELAEQRARRLRLQVTTNGTRLTEPRVDELRRLGVSVAVSIDGIRVAHEATRPRAGGGSSFDLAVAGARRVRARGMPLEVVCVVSPANVQWLARGVRFAADDLGAWRVHLNPAWNERWTSDRVELLEKQLQELAPYWRGRFARRRGPELPAFENHLVAGRRPCRFGDGHVAIAPSGRIYPCERLVGQDDGSSATFVIGHLDSGIERLQAGCTSGWCACANIAQTGSAGEEGELQRWYEAVLAGLVLRTPVTRLRPRRRLLPLAAGAALALTVPSVARAELADAGPRGILRLVLDHAEPDAGRGRVLVDGIALPQWQDGDAGAGVDVAVAPGAHTVRFERESGGNPSEFTVLVHEDAMVVLALGGARCSGDAPLGGAPPPPPPLSGGCCGGTHEPALASGSSSGRRTGAALGVGVACAAAIVRRRRKRSARRSNG
jgi:uncharacterized protein